jgi:hypothetical protein
MVVVKQIQKINADDVLVDMKRQVKALAADAFAPVKKAFEGSFGFGQPLYLAA